MLLKEVDAVQKTVKERKASTIKLLDKIICSNNDRLNRNRILNFEGFPFQIGDKEFLNKVKEVSEQFTLPELIKVCDILNISGEGVKDELSTNIISCLTDFELLNKSMLRDSNSEEETETEVAVTQNESVELSATNNVKSESNSIEQNKLSDLCKNIKESLSLSNNSQCININFNDIENIISKFSANSFENVNVWVQQFENVAKMLNLNELQKFIFAKRSLTGNALLYIKTEVNVDSWEKLKVSLLNEFTTDSNSARLHELLSRRQINDSESVFEYFLHMREIGNGLIDDAALMHYIINGIKDKPENKSILYGCKDLREFREKIKLYENMKTDCVKYQTNAYNMKQRRDIFADSKQPIRNNNCFSCGLKGHLSKHCTQKTKRVNCFNCGKLGHKSFECLLKNNRPKPLFQSNTKLGKVTHAVQDLPPNPCKFCAQVGIMNAFHWGYSCINRPSVSENLEPKQQTEK